MKKKTAFGEEADHESRDWKLAAVISVFVHIGFMVVIAFFSSSSHTRTVPIRAIDVDLSFAPPAKDMPATQVPKKKAAEPSVQSKKPSPTPSPAKKTSISTKKKEPVKKKKEPSPDQKIDNAIKRLEKDLNASRPETPRRSDPIADRLKRLEKEAGETAPDGIREGKTGGNTGDSVYQISLIDRYKYNVGMEVKENWAFSEGLAAGQRNLETLVSFEVLPDGEIRGLRIDRKSGNEYMDSASTMAVLKSNPVRPHPPGLNKPYIEVRLRFTPRGLE